MLIVLSIETNAYRALLVGVKFLYFYPSTSIVPLFTSKEYT